MSKVAPDKRRAKQSEGIAVKSQPWLGLTRHRIVARVRMLPNLTGRVRAARGERSREERLQERRRGTSARAQHWTREVSIWERDNCQTQSQEAERTGIGPRDKT